MIFDGHRLKSKFVEYIPLTEYIFVD